MKLQYIEYNHQTGRIVATLCDSDCTITVAGPRLSAIEYHAKRYLGGDEVAPVMLHNLALHIGCNGGSCRVDVDGVGPLGQVPAIRLNPREAIAA